MVDTRKGKRRFLRLRDKLFLSYALLSTVILLTAAWAANSQVVEQARQQVQEEMKASLPLYNAVWEEQAGRLSALGMAMAGSPIVKTIFGDPRASRDRETIRQMLMEFGPQLSGNVDLVLVSDGAGRIIFAESTEPALLQLKDLPSARAVAESQRPARSFVVLGGRFFHMTLTPVISHSGNIGIDNTMAVLVAGSELDSTMARELKRRAGSEVLFFNGSRLYASSLEKQAEAQAAAALASWPIDRGPQDQAAELMVAGESHLAFVSPLMDFDGRRVGAVAILHSLGSAGRLFRAISRRLVLIGTLGMILTLVLSYLIARRITRPIESLAIGAREFGKGNYEWQVDQSPDGEVGQLASAFEQMRQSIRQGQGVLLRNERLATVGQMASGVIHDLRNPLAAIATAAELFAHAELSTGQRQLLAQSQIRASQRMGAMLKEILDFSQGRYELRLERQPLDTLIRSVLQEQITPEIATRVSVEIGILPDLTVRVDVERSRRMFENLLVNALQAMPDGGTIRIFAAKAGEKVRINIADSGSGIPPQLRDRLFEPFVSQGKQGGTGLGLAVASSIAEAHGGSITLVSADGQPADFCVELPLVSGA